MQVELLYFDDCPNWKMVDSRLRELAAELDFELTRRLVNSPEDAEALSFHGSPSIIIDGRDRLAVATDPVGLSCRIYQTPDGPAGSPTLDQLREVLVT